MKPEVKNAINLLSTATAQLKLTKIDHMKIQDALDLIEKEIISLLPKAEQSIDNQANKALS